MILTMDVMILHTDITVCGQHYSSLLIDALYVGGSSHQESTAQGSFSLVPSNENTYRKTNVAAHCKHTSCIQQYF